MLGTFIDGLSDEQKDRVVRAQEWIVRGVLRDYDGRGCLMNHVEGCGMMEIGLDLYPCPGPIPPDIGCCFDRLARRFGKERVVRAIKLRAGANVEDLTPAERIAVPA